MARLLVVCLCLISARSGWGVPISIAPVEARNGIVVAGHPRAAAAGLAVLQSGGNAVDAAVATSLAVGVAEPFGSGLGGKLMLLYFEAKSGRTHAVDALDAAGAIDVAQYLRRPADERSYGYGAVCVPGLAAGLWAAHQRWGRRNWSENVQPAIAIARSGFRVLPKTRELFAEQEHKLRRGDTELARLYLPAGRLPEVGAILPNEELARTLERLAAHGRDGFYRGPVAAAIVSAVRRGGGVLTLGDLAGYEARIVDAIAADFRGYSVVSAPPPTSGAALFLPMLKVLENEAFAEHLRDAATLDRVGRVWRLVYPEVGRAVGDVPESRFLLEKLLAPGAIAAWREQLPEADAEKPKKVARAEQGRVFADVDDSAHAATTHFVVVDREGNVVCATQSLSLHFGAGVVPPGTGIVLNNTMSNFTYANPRSRNFVAPGKRPRSTISPTIVLRAGRPVLAAGIPGGARIPTAMLQLLLDRLVFDRDLAAAIGDTRFHYFVPHRPGDPEVFEAEQSLAHATAQALRDRGWQVRLPEAAGTGRYFGGINAVEFRPDGTLAGAADPRRSNAAAGY